MGRWRMRRLTIMSTLLLATHAGATEVCTEDAMIVFDGSGSMAEMGFNQIDEPRIFEARRAVRTALPPIAQSRDIGLIIYGPGGPDMCSGIDLRFAPRAAAAQPIIDAVDELDPEGSTPLTRAVKLAAETLDYRNRPGAIVVVTDGKETCGGTPCQLAVDLATTGHDLTVHVIGFKVRGEYFSWQSQGATDYSEAETVSRCLADRTGGTYVSAETVDDLIRALRVTLGCNVLF